MKFDSKVVAIALASLVTPAMAFQPNVGSLRTQSVMKMVVSPEVEDDITTPPTSAPTSTSTGIEMDHLTSDIVSKLRFREVQRELERRELDTSGTFTDMRTRLKELATDETKDEQTSDSSKDIRVIDGDVLNNVSAE